MWTVMNLPKSHPIKLWSSLRFCRVLHYLAAHSSSSQFPRYLENRYGRTLAWGTVLHHLISSMRLFEYEQNIILNLKIDEHQTAIPAFLINLEWTSRPRTVVFQGLHFATSRINITLPPSTSIFRYARVFRLESTFVILRVAPIISETIKMNIKTQSDH